MRTQVKQNEETPVNVPVSAPAIGNGTKASVKATADKPKAKAKAKGKGKAEITPVDVMYSYSVELKNRKGETLKLPAWCISPSGSLLVFRNGPKVAVRWDFITLRPGPKQSDEVNASEYAQYAETFKRISQKAGSEIRAKDVIKATSKHIGKGKNKDKNRVIMTAIAKVKADSANDQLAHARALSTAAREYLHPKV